MRRGATMTEVKDIAGYLQERLPRLKTGSLRFWGSWFGRPYDNSHKAVGFTSEGEILSVRFNDDESLQVWSPHGVHADERTFRIDDAARVRWEWFYYGRPKTPANRYFFDYVKSDGRVTVQTNVDWYTPAQDADIHAPAVEVLNFHDC